MSKDPWIYRLQKEFELIDAYCQQSKLVDYHAIPMARGLPPQRYTLDYHLRSIIGINAEKMPIYAEKHSVDIHLLSTYPMFSPPVCQAITDIWHPNIRYDGPHKGRICIAAESLGFWSTLDTLIEYIGHMLQYKIYHAQFIQPYPEDISVANWVCDFAEPQNIVNKNKGIYTDHRSLRTGQRISKLSDQILPE